MKLLILKILISFYINMSAMDLKEKIFLHYITFNDLLTEDILIFFLDKIIFYTDIRDSAEKILTDYTFKKTEKAKKTRKSEILNSE